jgi:hypothetical protein
MRKLGLRADFFATRLSVVSRVKEASRLRS